MPLAASRMRAWQRLLEAGAGRWAVRCTGSNATGLPATWRLTGLLANCATRHVSGVAQDVFGRLGRRAGCVEAGHAAGLPG